ncbi:13379_t:CDS:2 [Entrophospora sp. SA101]|nr:15416_t:CDS:2 [Entrophospora sp. SA101]CAJ0894462.1 13379_t:CDS:2 [Entrophospora sp. SA101]
MLGDFYDDGEWVNNCPSCNEVYITGKGVACLISCSDKQLEKEHERVIRKIKREFFDTVAHEAAHLIAYEIKFSQEERKIIEKYYDLKNKGELSSIYSIKEKDYYSLYKKFLDISEYVNCFNELLNSSYAKYAYGNTEPRKYEEIIEDIENAE